MCAHVQASSQFAPYFRMRQLRRATAAWRTSVWIGRMVFGILRSVRRILPVLRDVERGWPDSLKLSGFIQRNAGNRAKSPSVEYKVSPCSSASAAKCASGTRLACTPGSARSSSNKSAWRSVGCGIHAVPHASQARTCRHASTIGSGRSNIETAIFAEPGKVEHGSSRPTLVEAAELSDRNQLHLVATRQSDTAAGNELRCDTKKDIADGFLRL